MFWTMNEIIQSNKAAGRHWFDEDTMRFFDSRIEAGPYQGPGGIFFVSSEASMQPDFSGPRRYSIRQFFPETCDVKTYGQVQAFGTKDLACTLALAVAKKSVDIEQFRV